MSVHPRTSGEHSLFEFAPPEIDGSSPHQRGTFPIPDTPGTVDRFIPAPAGNMSRHGCQIFSRTVHPRTSGEHSARRFIVSITAGSSPHQRGTLVLSGLAAFDYRFIPAPAGNIDHPQPAPWLFPVHPRTSGEHSFLPSHKHRRFGSSPHQRGTFIKAAMNIIWSRFIPAPAGNIVRPISRFSRRAVHPRTSGEHAIKDIRERFHLGSSPHQRGTSISNQDSASVDRFIPAPAGNIYSEGM